MKTRASRRLTFAAAVWLISTSAFGYGGTIGPNEYVGRPPNRTATDYKNPLPVPGEPHHYHITICNDTEWYGVWYPPEWRGNDGRVRGTPNKVGQHGYAKEEDGTGGGVQIMGNGAGGTTNDVTLTKENGDTVVLTIHVVDCSHAVAPGATRGQVAAVVWVNGSRTGLKLPPDSAKHLKAVVAAVEARQMSAGEEARHAALRQALPELFGTTAKFVPACSPTTYTTNVNCTMLVTDCDKITPAEAQSMGACLQDKGQKSADTICQLNSTCPKARLIGATETRNDCPSGGRQWEVDVKWTFECK